MNWRDEKIQLKMTVRGGGGGGGGGGPVHFFLLSLRHFWGPY